MSYRIAKALDVLRDQVNRAWPKRNKASDGWIGDSSHQARKSDHNSNPVRALDITHDPNSGCHAGKIAESVKDDPRTKYVIWNRRIWNASIRKTWRVYRGSNPHTRHVHISVLPNSRLYDSTEVWNIEGSVSPFVTSPMPEIRRKRPLLRQGAKGALVKELQKLLNKRGISPILRTDADFGRKTRSNVLKFQRLKGLDADGLVGAYTWDALLS